MTPELLELLGTSGGAIGGDKVIAKPQRGTRVWKNKDFVILVSGQWVSQIGNSLFQLAVFWYVLSETHRTTDLAWVGAIMALPGILGMLSGVFADRLDRRRTMIGSDVVRLIVTHM